MHRLLLLLPLAAALAGCTIPRYAMVPSTDTKVLGVISLGTGLNYYIDPRTETCMLVISGPDSAFGVAVPCAKLKANVPEAARFITWDEPAPGR
jgi:hypothetical protein